MNQQESINWISSMNISNECEKCGGVKAVDQDSVSIIINSDSPITKTYDGFTMTCRNCGYLDIFKSNVSK